MPKLNYKNGITSVILRVKILDNTSTTGAGKTGMTSSSSGLIISTIADNEATPTVYAQASSNIETITTLGTFAAPTSGKCRFKEVDATNHPGLYEIQIADARWAVSGARSVIVSLSGFSGMAQVDAEIQLEPAAADVTRWSGTNVASPDTAGYPKVTIKDGTGTGELDTNAGKVLLADNAITASVIATDAIDADAMKTDAWDELVALITVAVAEVADIWDFQTASATTAGSIGKLIVDNLNGAISAVLGRLPSALVSGRMDSSVGAMATDTLTSGALATSAVTELVDAYLAGIASVTGTATAGAAGTITLASPASTVADYYINQWIYIRSGTGAGQSRRIKSYSTGRVATVDGNWATNPDSTSVYYVFPAGRVDVGTHLGTSVPSLASGRFDVSVGAYQTGLAPLQPTTAGRTLDVSATGEAGVDWANVGSPTTVVALSGTTVKTATDVETDTQDIQSRLPAALVSGRMDASVGAMATDSLSAAALATAAVNEIVDAILAGLASTTGTAAAGAAGTITLAASAVATTDYYINQWVWIRSGTGLGQARRIKSYTSGRVATVDGNWATTPDTTSVYYILPSGRVDLGTILGTSVPTLVSGRLDVSVGAYQTGLTPLQPTTSGRTLDVSVGGEAGIDLANVGSPTTVVNLSGLTIKTATDVEADTQDLQSRTPATLVGGRMDSNIGAVSGNTSVMAAFLAALGVQTIGTVTATTLGVSSFSTNVSSTDNAWRYHTIMFTSGALNKHARTIVNYTNTNGLITVDDPFPSAPANGDTFVIL